MAGIFINERNIGVLGELHPAVISNWGLIIPISALELNLDEIMKWSYKPVEVA